MKLTPTYRKDIKVFLEAAQRRPFTWGSFDCVHFTADAIEVLTGVDLLGDYRKMYRTKRDALIMLRDKNLVERTTEQLRVKPQSTGPGIRTGDIVMAHFGYPDGEPLLGFGLSNLAYFKAPSNLLALPPQACEVLWRLD